MILHLCVFVEFWFLLYNFKNYTMLVKINSYYTTIYFTNKHEGLNDTTEKHAFLKLVDRVRFPLWVTQQT